MLVYLGNQEILASIGLDSSRSLKGHATDGYDQQGKKMKSELWLLHLSFVRQILVDSFGNREDGLVEKDVRTFQGHPVIFAVPPPQVFVRINGSRCPDIH